MLVALTLSDHLWGLHLCVGIDMVMAMRENPVAAGLRRAGLDAAETPGWAGSAHILPQQKREEARSLMRQYQMELAELCEDIERKNTSRRHPFRSFCPRYLEVSVSL